MTDIADNPTQRRVRDIVSESTQNIKSYAAAVAV